MMKAILVCMLFSAVSIEAIVNPGKCVNVPVIKDFNAPKYLGNWYEIERFNYIFEDFLKCLVATYGPINSTFVSVHNQGVNIISGKTHSVDGYAYIADLTHPNKLTVNLPISLLNETLFRNNADYEVVDTDYTNYALVYSCINLPLVDYKDEFVWILGRTKSLDIKVINNLKEKLTKLGVDTKPLVVIDQSCQ